MAKSCLNPIDSKVIAMVDSNRSNFPNYSDNQIITLGNLYYDQFGKLPTPEQLLEFKADLDIQSPDEAYNQEEVTEKDDALDIMQSLFFKILSKAAKGKSISKSFLIKAQEPVFDAVKKTLEKNGLFEISENFNSYKTLLISSRLKNLNIDLDASLETEVEQSSKDNNWDKDSTMTNNYERASDEVIYLFASLTSNEKVRGIPRPVNFSQAWNQTQNLLAGTSDLRTQVDLLRLSKFPFKDQLLSAIGYANYEEFSEVDYNIIRTSFMESFAKNANSLSKSSPGKSTIDSIEESIKQQIKQRWKSNFLASDFAALIGDKRTLNPEKYEQFDNAAGQEFLSMLGIEVNEWDDSLNNIATLIKKHFYNKQIKGGENLSWLDESKEITKSLKTLLDYQVKFEKEDRPLGARNADGEYQHSIGNHSFLSKKIGLLQHGLVQAKTTFEYLFANARAVLNIDQGMSANGNAKSFSSLAKGDIYTSVISDMFSSQPIMHLPRTADKSSEKGVKLIYNKTISQGKEIKDYFNQYMAYTEIGEKLYERLYNQYKADFVKKPITEVGFKTKTYKPPVAFWNEILELEQSLEVVTLNSFKAKIDNYLNIQLDPLFSDLQKYGVIKKFREKYETAFSPAFIGEGFENKSFEVQKSLLNAFLKRYIFNSLLYGTELTNFTIGSLSLVDPADFFKRTAGPIAEGRQPRADDNFIQYLDGMRPDYMSKFPTSSILKVMISKEQVVASKTKEYNKLGNTEAYSKNNVDDAQGKMLFENYREYKISLNEWTNLQEDGYQKLVSGKKLTKDYNILYPPLKPVGFSLVNIKGVDVPIYLKTAIYPIHKNLVQGTLNESAYNKMIEKGIAIHLPQSGIKLAFPSNLQEQFKDGEFQINEDAIFDFPLSDFRSQLDIAMKDSFKQLMGTQQQKLIASNMFENGKAIDEYFSNWPKERTATLQEISDIELAKLQKKADIEIKNGIPVIKNYNKLKQMLKDELLSRSLPINTIEAINELIDEDGNLISTIDALPSRQKLMNLLNSIVTNKLIKLHTNGAALVQIAQTGWELAPGSTIETETSIDFISNEVKQNYIDNNGLQFLQIDEKTGAAEILLPNKFKNIVDKEGKVDEKALINIGYRIPTQGLNSILHLKVIGFLPAGLDQVVVMPREITTQGGSDFDVDKLNLFVPNTINGKYITQEMNPEDAWKAKERNKENRGLTQEEIEIQDKLWESIYGDLDLLEETDLDVIQEKEDWIQNFKLKQLQNKLIEQSIEVLEHENSINSLLTPNSAAELEELAKKVTKGKDKIKTSEAFSPKVLVSITEQMYSSKALVGVFASQITHHVLSQQVGLHFKTGRKFYFKHNTIEGNPSISAAKNQEGNLITDRIGNQYVSGAVDAAKNPFLFDLGCNLDTGAMFALFERLGGNVEILVKLIQQPIIQDYLLAMSNNKQLGNPFTISNVNILKDILKKYGSADTNSEYLTEYYNHSEEKENILETLKEKRKDFGDWESNLSKLSSQISNFNEVQKFVLDDFLYLKDAASIVGESISTSKFDTAGPGKDVIQSTLLNENYEKFKEKMAGDFGYTLATIKGPYDKLITDTLLNVFYNKSAKFTLNLYRDLVLLMKNGYVNQIVKEFNNPDNGFVNKKLTEEDATLLYGSIVNYVIQNNEGLVKNLFFGDNTTARKVLNIQKDLEHPLHNNYLFTNVLNSEIGNGESIPDIISMQNKSIDSKEADFILKAFGDLKDKDLDLYNEMIKINLFQTGVVQSPVSFYSLIPYNDVLPVISTYINNHQNTANASTKENIEDALMANIGMKLQNIQRVRWKEGMSEFGDSIRLRMDQSKGKEYVVYSQKKKVKGKTEVSQGAFKHMGDGRYDLLQPQNYKTLFYNMTQELTTPIETIPSDIELEQEVNLQEQVEETVIEVPKAWDALTSTQQEQFMKKGITPENFNSWAEEKQTLYITCNG